MCLTPSPAAIHALVLTTILLAGAAAVAATETVVNACGQETSGPATLAADLDCTGFAGRAVTMHGGTLAMNGHTIRGGAVGIECDAACRIIGPGTVTASTSVGVNALKGGLEMSQVDVSECEHDAVQASASARINGPAVFSGNATAISVRKKATLTDLTITGNGIAVSATALGGKSGSIVAVRCTVSGNGLGLAAERDIKVIDSTIRNNATVGIYAAGGVGCVRRARAIVKGSTVTGNGTECRVDDVCADIATCRKRPLLKFGSTCETSLDFGAAVRGTDWDVCALD